MGMEVVRGKGGNKQLYQPAGLLLLFRGKLDFPSKEGARRNSILPFRMATPTFSANPFVLR
jgi:hypothetical protein